MKRVLILVEGQTEERFVKDVLRPALWPKAIDIIPKIVTTKRVKKGPDFKGGITEYQKVENDLRRLLGDMVHEFEALLFARPDELAKAVYQTDAKDKLMGIRASFPSLEDIDDDPQNAPSKRIIRIVPSYQKTLHGRW